MSDEFKDPSTATGIEWKNFNGSLLLVKVHGQEHSIKTVHGDSSAIRADVFVLDGDHSGESYVDTLVFPKVLQSQLKPSIGAMVLGRLGQGHKKPGQSAPWTLAAATAEDKTLGREFLAKSVDTPF
ncbi:hypothetical protein [Amycolatopsis sp. PS_44_ISF1]|uniref:hypothetical protein n=1 Tax=Amycolatopsis sp. PS_44_ISF1 TaxID=2974917 RepID=UPI0028DFF6FC|nr:hypothetical protein [Amycolatopsis sp. PS_44_ISF1]MDT8915783.1 hypothetical protein [Amycolatopsis sp. PS_44_ISF1]MDT8916187.1 hypothetical protein [Amycolatopsis sp. PS_44_ISF1]